MSKILLIDGNSVLFRGFYATCYGNIMKTSAGVYTNAIYAFANMLNKALKMIEPDYCVVAFDKGKHTFRHELNPDYKGGRKETPPELAPQFAIVREMMDAYNIKYLEYDDIEADDIIGTMAKRYDLDTCILSSDRDLLQLIDNTTAVYVMRKGMSDIGKMNEEALMDEYGLKPYQIIDYKGLAGDKSDNIKGVEGVGDKTAVKLLVDYDTCEGIYEHIDEIKGKLKEKLIADKDSCFLSKKLATIKTDVEIDWDLETFKLNINNETKNEFFKKYEMNSLVKDTTTKVNSISTKVSKISDGMYADPLIYFVSNEFSYYNREFVAVSFTIKDRCEYISYEDYLNDEKAKAFVASSNPKTVFDIKVLKHNLKIGENTDDLLLMAFLCNNYQADLASIIKAYGYEAVSEIKDLFGSEKKPNEINEIDLINYTYSVSNSLYSILLKVRKELKEKKLTDLYKNIELPLANVLYNMEKQGIICDTNTLDEISKDCEEKIDSISKQIYEEVGHEFNISSPKQLAEVLFEELELPDLKKGSTNADVLGKLIDYHPVVSLILDYRKYSKLNSTYAVGLKKYVQEDNKIHTIFSQTITQTGRLSSYEPNLQNISVRDDESREIRKAFRPSENHLLISSDYSQVELRVLADLANEEKMIEAFNSGIDIHTKTAMDVFKVNEDDVTPLIRRHAKAVNFGVVYGISDFGLANQTSLSFKDAKKFIDEYFETYPKIKEYLDNQVEFCKANGYVKTMENRRRYINEIYDANYMTREFGKRAAMNATIQGSAADITKKAMIDVFNYLENNNMKSKLILQVHDELIIDACKDELETLKKDIPSIMANASKMKVKLDTSIAYGDTWYEAK